MKKIIFVSAGLALLLLAIVLTGCSRGYPAQAQSPSSVSVNFNQQQGIFVSGQGKVTVAPDTAIVSLGISAQAAGVAQAQSQAADAMTKVMNALTGNGVDKKDIKTQYFNIQQVTRYDKDKQQDIVIGYRVTNTVTVKIRAVDKAGAIIDAVAAAGGDLTRVNNISFTIDDPSPFLTEARKKAMDDARTRAEQLANLGGIKLGKPTYISESSYTPTPPYPISRGDMAVPAPTIVTPISPGEMDITVTVQVTYSIL